jgi:hypothetical protein
MPDGDIVAWLRQQVGTTRRVPDGPSTPVAPGAFTVPTAVSAAALTSSVLAPEEEELFGPSVDLAGGLLLNAPPPRPARTARHRRGHHPRYTPTNAGWPRPTSAPAAARPTRSPCRTSSPDAPTSIGRTECSTGSSASQE